MHQSIIMLSAQENQSPQIGHSSLQPRVLPNDIASEACHLKKKIVEPNDICLEKEILKCCPTKFKQEPVDFSITGLTSYHEKQMLNSFQTTKTDEGLSIKSEPPSSRSYERNCSGMPYSLPQSGFVGIHDNMSFSNATKNLEIPHFSTYHASSFDISTFMTDRPVCNPDTFDLSVDHPVNMPETSDHAIYNSMMQSELLAEHSSEYISTELSSTLDECLTKVPVVRICRQNSSSLYTASTNCAFKEAVPLKPLPNNVERRVTPSPLANDVTENLQNPRTQCQSSDAVKPLKRKARLKFSPRIKNFQNAQVPFRHLAEDKSFTVVDKENQNVGSKMMENNVSYRWDMSAFPKCIVQLKKLPLNMKSVFLAKDLQRSCVTVVENNEKDTSTTGCVLERPDLNKSPDSLQSDNVGIPLEDRRRKKRSVQPREKTRCSFCGMLTLSVDVWRHLLAVYKVKDDLKNEVIENQETITCEVCGAGLCSAVALSMHMHNLHNKKQCEDSYKCIICDKLFHTQTHLAFHLQYHYCDQQSKMKTLPLSSVSPDSTSLPLQYECLTCHKKFQRYQALNAHKRLHRQQTSLECHFCGKMFSKRYKLKCHLVVHTNEKPFKCEECGKLFRFKSNLRSHKFFHIGVNSYKCKFCDQGFIDGGNLVKHIRRTHQGHRSEICNICGKVLTDKQALKYHMRLHNNLHLKRRNVFFKSCAKSWKRETSKNKSQDEASVSADLTNKTNQTAYENSVLFHLLTTSQNDKQQNDQQKMDLYEWSDSTADDTCKDHDSEINSHPNVQRECLLCDMMFYTTQKMKKHLLFYHRICSKKLRMILP